MTIHAYKNVAVSALAVAALGWAVSAQAAGTDYLLKLGGVDGESKDPKPQSAKGGDHKGWIVLESVQLGAERTTGGVTVASGDVNGDGTDAASGRRTYEPITIRKRIDKSTPAPPTKGKIAAPADNETDALLRSSVKSLREAKMRMPAWEGCAAGQKIEGLAIKQKTTGRMGRILDATVVSCASDEVYEETVIFQFGAIEWN